MILSEYDRRWAEIRFYTFCVDAYHMRNKSIDIINLADTICELSGIDHIKIRNIIRVMLNDTYYQATKREILLVGNKCGLTTVQLGRYTAMTRQGVSKFLKTHEETFTPLPRCGIDEDYEIYKFMETLDKVQQIGLINNARTNQDSI